MRTSSRAMGFVPSLRLQGGTVLGVGISPACISLREAVGQTSPCLGQGKHVCTKSKGPGEHGRIAMVKT